MELPENSEETIEQVSPETIGDYNSAAESGRAPSDPSSRPSEADDDNLQICDPGDLLCDQSPDEGDSEDDRPIGQTALPPPPTSFDDSGDKDFTEKTHDNGSTIKKLSDEQVNNIRSNLMNGDSDYVSAQDASSIIHDLSKKTEGPTLQRQNQENAAEPEPIIAAGTPEKPPEIRPEKPRTENSMPAPKTAPMRKVAYFHKNFIQLTGSVNPTSGEEMVIDDRHYLLKPKKIKPQYTIGVFSVLVVLLLFVIGKQFISPTLPGSGSVIGVVLDEYDRPILTGIEIALPESGQKTVSNALGFFRFDNVPTGVYVLRYTLEDGKVGNENISVANDEITMLALDAEGAEEPVTANSNVSGGKQPPATTARVQNNSNKMPPVPEEKKQEAVSSASSQKSYSAIKLQANVEDAKLVVNGEVLGAGNMTYKKLAPGNHKAKVTKTGYKAWSGSIKLNPDETYTLSVNLEKVASETQETSYSAEDFYQSGKTMLADGNVDAAIQDFSEAINIKPSMADAYFDRASAYLTAGNKPEAEADLIRAGEIYSSQKRTESAMSAFDKAIEINKESVNAYINRGDIYRRQDRKDEALQNFKSALKYDKNNFRANFELGKMYFAMANHKDADKMLRRAREIDGANPEVYHYLMLNYFARDDFGKVKKTYTDFKDNVSSDEQQAFRENPRFDAILRIVGEYDRP